MGEFSIAWSSANNVKILARFSRTLRVSDDDLAALSVYDTCVNNVV